MKILVAEDNRFFRRMLESHLARWGHDAVSCEDGDQALAHLRLATGPRVAVLDWEMPKIQGVDVCRTLRAMKDHHYVYVILLTAKSRKLDIVEGLKSGADDYIVKPFNPFELEVRLRAATRIVELQEKLQTALHRAEARARHDELTQILNRSAILEVLEKEVERSKRLRTPLGVIMADVDHFKKVNDSYGHLTGDRILKSVATVLKQGVRIYDSVGRYGGDEFLVVLPNCGQEETLSLAERIRRTVRSTSYRLSERSFACTISLGVTALSEFEHVESAHMLHAADAALYEAKRKGRNRADSHSAGTDRQKARIL